jgi:predicted DNA repair protein MutK
MSRGLFALLDDVAAIAKIAAASIDDVAGQAVDASSKAAGVVIDDAAVTPKYVVGFRAERELPMIVRIAKGSLRTKLLMLLPGALILSAVAPWALNPLLVLGGAYLCFEGFEKIVELVAGHEESSTEEATLVAGASLEDQRVKSALRTDVILSAEIMAVTLASVADASLVAQAVVMAAVGVLITVVVYGVVALLVKADDIGVVLARRKERPLQVVGRGLVTGMPSFLRILSLVGIAAMLWVGGGIVLHAVAGLGAVGPEHVVADLAAGVGRHVAPALTGLVEWGVKATLSALAGVVIGMNVLAVASIIKRLRARPDSENSVRPR